MTTMCLQTWSKYPEANRLRRKSIVMAGCCSSLAGIPALTPLHHHSLVAGVCIGAQIVLLVLSLRFLFEAKKVATAARESGMER